MFSFHAVRPLIPQVMPVMRPAKLLLVAGAALTLAACCAPHARYRLEGLRDGDIRQFSGTVLSIEPDGSSFVMESHGKWLLVDKGNLKHAVEIGDQLTVLGVVDVDEGEPEAPELDAVSITPGL